MPEYLPGTERYYLDEMSSRMGFKRAGQLIGKNIPADVYLKTYDALANHYPELGYPCFQSALADLYTRGIPLRQVLEKGKVGFLRDGDEASWLNVQADILLSRGKFHQAVPFLEKAQTLSPEREDVARNLAVAYYNEHHIDRALDEARLAVQLAPSSEDDRKLLSQLLSLHSTP